MADPVAHRTCARGAPPRFEPCRSILSYDASWIVPSRLPSNTDAVSKLRSPGRVAKVVLFGSRARGDADADSDWDVAVFLRDDVVRASRAQAARQLPDYDEAARGLKTKAHDVQDDFRQLRSSGTTAAPGRS